MGPNLALISDGKKFMWDGRHYASREEASQTENAYRSDHFEVHLVEEDGQVFVYTRRTAKEAALTQA
jgi:hypothetical protein